MHAGLGRRIIGLPELALAAVDRRDTTMRPQPRSTIGSMNGLVTLNMESRLVRSTASQPALSSLRSVIAGDAGVVHQDVDPMTIGVMRRASSCADS
jgi:hypothetical protein